jgi:excisionase family DNA binding protein
VKSNEALERLVARETFAEMLDVLRPLELMIAFLRGQGRSDVEIGEMLDFDPSGVWRRMERTRARVIEEVPELRSDLSARRRRRHKARSGESPPLERVRICRLRLDECDIWAEATPDLTTAQVAQYYGVSPCTVRRWIQAGRFPHAYQLDNRRREYRVPEGDLED